MSPMMRRLLIGGMLLFIVILPLIKHLVEIEKRHLDKEVDRLCAIDGGIIVHETVTLPKEKFNRYGQPLVPQNGRDDSGFGYYVENVVDSISQVRVAPTASLQRSVTRIVRSRDKKVLATSVVYGRGGGDFLEGGFLTPRTSHVCPSIPGWDFLLRVFKMEE